jgi:LPS O-antigen subunit length determinant protein (WzzB/FepE family)
MNNTQEQYQDDESDLYDLLTALRGNKFLIIAITAIFAIAGIAYAFLAPQVWNAKAIVVAPYPPQLKHLQNRLDQLNVLIESTKKNGPISTNITINNPSSTNNNPIITNKQAEFLAAFSADRLFDNFINRFGLVSHKLEFLKKTESIRQNEMKKGGSLQLPLEEMARNISVQEKKNEELKTLSFGGDKSQELGKLLDGYINFIQAKEVEAKTLLLAEIIADQISVLNLKYKVQEAAAFKRLEEEITLTEFSLRVCKAAGLENPVENLNSQSIFNIDFGAKALNEKLKILKEIKNPEIIDPELANIHLQIESLQAFPQEKVNFNSYYFLQSPSEPLSRDKPKRFLLVALATLAGLLTGVFVAWFRAKSLSRDCKTD